jgi:hypothetical protein
MCEDALDHRCRDDGRDDLQLAATVLTAPAVDLEGAPEQPGWVRLE